MIEIKSEKQIDFSNANVEAFSELSDKLGDTLIKAGFGLYVDYLSQIRLAADKHDEETFKKSVISSELFGGSGALWEIWIEEKQYKAQFNKLFADYIDLLKQMGIRNKRMNQVRRFLKNGNA